MKANCEIHFDDLSKEQNAYINRMVENKLYEMAISQQEESKAGHIQLTSRRLVDVIDRPGYYVDYDAGQWSQTVPMPDPTEFLRRFKYGFGGWKAGRSKNDSVRDFFGRDSPSGWRVLTQVSGHIYLIHAGIAAVYSPPKNTITSKDIEGLNNFCDENFVNKELAILSASINLTLYRMLMKYEKTGLDESISDINTSYWFSDIPDGKGINYKERIPTKIDPDMVLDKSLTPEEYVFYETSTDKYGNSKNVAQSVPEVLNKGKIVNVYGVRPVVKLKTDVVVTGGNGTQEAPFKIAVE